MHSELLGLFALASVLVSQAAAELIHITGEENVAKALAFMESRHGGVESRDYSAGNVTIPELAHLQEREADTNEWFATFWTGMYCTNGITDAYYGTGPTNACVGVGASGKVVAVSWYPYSSGNTIHVWTSNDCGDGCCGTQGGPSDSGCIGIPANVVQSGIESFYTD